jgi:hypothetical protein
MCQYEYFLWIIVKILKDEEQKSQFQKDNHMDKM